MKNVKDVYIIHTLTTKIKGTIYILLNGLTTDMNKPGSRIAVISVNRG